MVTDKKENSSSPGRGRVFRAKFQVPAQTLKSLNPEVVEMLAKETGSKAIGEILAGGLERVNEISEVSWDFSWDFSWDYATKAEQVSQQLPQIDR